MGKMAYHSENVENAMEEIRPLIGTYILPGASSRSQNRSLKIGGTRYFGNHLWWFSSFHSSKIKLGHLNKFETEKSAFGVEIDFPSEANLE